MKIIKNCLICGKEVHFFNNVHSTKLRRRAGAVTCSKKCSKVYERVYHYIYDKIRKGDGK